MDYDKLYGNRKVDYQATDLTCLLAMSRIRRVTIVLRMSGAAGRDIQTLFKRRFGCTMRDWRAQNRTL